ncbi:MAG: 6-phosphofructokinase [Gammaproteobacteria bacterium]|jgi:6-phosphofructokinase 1|nr:6-phosphofructokinase [Gammaproteobacteria bacterium]MCH2576870.1 6-phosphofructokinase [Pseudomonadales bacterium]MEC7766105.1 6-phosphofructokinase [Pseudomonadota bacterium]MEC8950244.1 6-phosphofructokinase [Pseudomonadota bacterium]MEC8995291.1 6-phosphofructokinase [Pseudomonadota bacterium]|tara:strand:+ start:300 stop:1562 length:1263 start_codon:yes stop_codon:yes gene_type:complete
MSKANLFYAQSGGVTSVINASACGVIETARLHKDTIGKVYAGLNGILGALNEDLIDTSRETKKTIAALRSTPAGAFGSCRYKLKSYSDNQREYERLMEVFQAHNIRYFLYNGGGDSQDTANKVSQLSLEQGFPITCIGIPKTVDNDLPITDNCPGFGSVAKYVAVSIREAGLDVASMCASSTKVFVMEVMGRHAGWIAGAAGLSTEKEGDAPHIILFPEIAFNKDKFLKKVKRCVSRYGYCAIVVSEGVQYKNGKFLAEAGGKDAFGHVQLGGVAPFVANMIKDELGYKYHWAVADYLQRAARHIASATDVKQAYAVGKVAVELALKGKTAVMPIIIRGKGKKYTWRIGEVKLSDVANAEKVMPRDYITRDGLHITEKARAYFAPLIQGEDYPVYKQGIPQYARLKKVLEKKKLKKWHSA